MACTELLSQDENWETRKDLCLMFGYNLYVDIVSFGLFMKIFLSDDEMIAICDGIKEKLPNVLQSIITDDDTKRFADRVIYSILPRLAHIRHEYYNISIGKYNDEFDEIKEKYEKTKSAVLQLNDDIEKADNINDKQNEHV
jgi:hypothetical protein